MIHPEVINLQLLVCGNFAVFARKHGTHHRFRNMIHPTAGNQCKIHKNAKMTQRKRHTVIIEMEKEKNLKLQKDEKIMTVTGVHTG